MVEAHPPLNSAHSSTSSHTLPSPAYPWGQSPHANSSAGRVVHDTGGSVLHKGEAIAISISIRESVEVVFRRKSHDARPRS
eukprot:482758-Pyramimonas_sp.AAC.2